MISNHNSDKGTAMSTDATLLIQFQNGDEGAFDKIYSQYNQVVKSCIRSYAKGRLKNEIDDICQYFWIKLFRLSKNYDTTKSVEAWIVACAKKAVLGYEEASRFHSVKNKKIYHDSDIRQESMSFEQIANVGPGSQEILSQKEEFEIVSKAMKKIHPTHQRILRRVLLKGETIPSCAKSEGISLNGVYKIFQDAIKRLRETQEVKNLMAARC